MSPEGLLAFFLPFPSSLAPSPVRSSFVRSLDRLQNGKRETPIVGVTGGSLCHLPHSSFVRSLDRTKWQAQNFDCRGNRDGSGERPQYSPLVHPEAFS